MTNRVGESTQANRTWGVSKRAWSMGSAKAPVLPEPVCASPIKSFPETVIIENKRTTDTSESYKHNNQDIILVLSVYRKSRQIRDFK